jgi:predicted nucleic acid-binding protein
MNSWSECGDTVSSPLLDTNVFVHSLTNDILTAECSAFLDAVRSSVVTAELDIVVLHELTYSVPRYLKGISQRDLVRLLSWLVEMPGINCDKTLFSDTLTRWSEQPGLGFVDAYLAARASRDGTAVFTKNVRELRAQGVIVPDPLPS